MSYICRDCLETVGNGDAILRSVSFQVVAYCRECWQDFHAAPLAADVVPAPRRSIEEVEGATPGT
jgi:hypothetical protein